MLWTQIVGPIVGKNNRFHPCCQFFHWFCLLHNKNDDKNNNNNDNDNDNNDDNDYNDNNKPCEMNMNILQMIHLTNLVVVERRPPYTLCYPCNPTITRASNFEELLGGRNIKCGAQEPMSVVQARL